jgi:dihydroorotate dehydrogenase
VIGFLDGLARPLLRRIDPESAHRVTIAALKFAPLPRPAADDPLLRVRAFGLNFPSPVGMAPGFDKDAEVPDALLRLGFGFVEIGTVTPRPQSGNARPRVFRLEADGAVINRLGFNSAGEVLVLERMAARAEAGGIVGLNIGANRDSPDRVADYVRLLEAFAPVANYVTVNVSSPNTPGLRNLQQPALLDDLIARILAARDRVAIKAGPTPVLIKIAPDLSLAELDDIVGVARARGVDGMIVSNTSVRRPSAVSARDPHAGGDLCAGRGRLRAGRRRRHRFTRRGAGKNSRRRLPGPALYRPDLSRPAPPARDQGRISAHAARRPPRLAVRPRRHGRRGRDRRALA